MLTINNLSIYVEEKRIIDKLNLVIKDNEIHVLMGKNGIGKSSLAKVLIGDNNYKIKGKIIYNGEDINNLKINERSKKGIYLVSQSPIAVEGVTNAEMLRMALSDKNKLPVNIFDFNKELEYVCELLELDKGFIHKEINVGASGGERKKIELLHMWLLKPSFIILDEIDSGLDVDAIKVVIKFLKKYIELYSPSILIITHSNVLINAFNNIHVHILEDGKLMKNGGKKLANLIIKQGFKSTLKANTIRGK